MSDEDDPTAVLTEFFGRSVKQNPVTGIKSPFVPVIETQELKGHGFRDDETTRVSQPPPTQALAPPTPSITSINPTSGSTAGGTHVNIIGDRFSPDCTVNFDGVPEGPNGTFTDPQHIMAVTPAHVAGLVDVEVENVPNNPQFAAELVNAYRFVALAVTAVQPNNGKAVGGTIVTVVGSDFVAGVTVFFNNVAATSVHWLDSTHIQCTTPAHPSGFGTVAVKVHNPDGREASANVFTYYPAPFLTSIVPDHAPGNVLTSLIVNGGNFVFNNPDAYHLYFGGILTTGTRNDPNINQLRVVSPLHPAGLVDVYVLSPDNDAQTGFLHNGFTFDAPGSGSIPTHWFSFSNTNPLLFPHSYQYTGFVVGPVNLYAYTQNMVFDPTYNGPSSTIFAHFSYNMASFSYSISANFVNGVAQVSWQAVRGPLTGFGHNGEYELYAGAPLPNGYSNFLCYGTAVDPVYTIP